VVDNQASTETAKTEALSEINNLAKVMEQEANIETLIIAKGFENCVAVISGDKANIVVKSESLLPAQISQINEIVYDQAGILPVNINITER
jgi:stage III sporulation protein AH